MDLRLLYGHGHEAIGIDGPGDLANDERETARHGRKVEDDDHLVRPRSCMHAPYLTRHCRRNMVGSLPRGMPEVVDYR